MLLRVEVIGDELVAAKLRTSKDVIREESVAGMEETRDVLQAARLANVPRDTGYLAERLSSEIKVDRVVKRVTSEYGYSAGAEYGRPVNVGTGIYGEFKRPYPVRHPSGSVYLHPGMVGRYFEQQSIYDTREEVSGIWNLAGARMTERLN